MSRWRRTARRFVLWLAALAVGSGIIVSYPWLLRMVYPIPFKEYVDRAAKETDLDPLLIVAVMRVESRFNPRAESGKGARGLMQVMPDTGTWVAAQIGIDRFHPDLLFDPETNVHIGSWYLAYLTDRFEGRQVAALAAYNGGQGNVRRWLETSRWDGRAETIHQIPFGETRSYVEKVLHTHLRYRDVYEERWIGEAAPTEPAPIR